MNFQTMTKQRKFILIAAAAGVLSVFLPWITVSAGILGFSSSESTNGFHGAGIFYLILMAGIAVVAAMGDSTQLLDKSMRLVVMIGGVIATICVLMIIKNATDNSATGGFAIVDASPSVGAFLAIAMSIAVIILPLVFKSPGESLQGDFDHLKKKIQSVSNSNTTGSHTPSGTNRVDELERLIDLKAQGKITEEEYQELKSKLVV